jgi:hypothetical protein
MGEERMMMTTRECCNEPQQWKYNGHGAVQPSVFSCGTGHGTIPRWRICEHEEAGGRKPASERELGDT